MSLGPSETDVSATSKQVEAAVDSSLELTESVVRNHAEEKRKRQEKEAQT
jgi:hypothetical protein